MKPCVSSKNTPSGDCSAVAVLKRMIRPASGNASSGTGESDGMLEQSAFMKQA
jgi:hypothetical protein